MQEEHIALFFKEGSSDKEYHVHLIRDPLGRDGWVVNYANGKRGKSLRNGTKTAEPVTYEEAKKIYDRVVKGQLKDGYTPDESGTPYQPHQLVDSTYPDRQIGANPQILQKVTTETVLDLMENPDYFWQEKMDGERRPIVKHESGVVGGNRDGLAVPLPQNLADAVMALPVASLKIDGEDMGGGRYAAFDLISCPEDPEGKRPAQERYLALLALLAKAPSPCWIAVPTAFTPEDAKRLLKEVAARNGEGLVGKLASAPYAPGETTDLSQVKFPFLDRATCFVTAHSAGKRSVAYAVHDKGGNTVPLGNVTIPANYDIPDVGAIIDVEYLYAFRNGCLNQPRYKGIRGDRRLEHCTQDQLKYEQARNYQLLTGEDDETDSTDCSPGI